MPIQVDIFNKKILSSQSRFGTYNILLSGDADNNAYPNSNPSGFITGVDLSNCYTNNNPSGFITSYNVVFTTGDQVISGSKTFAASRYIFSGANVIFIHNTGISSGHWQFSNRPTVNDSGVLLEGEAYASNNPSGYITSENVVYATGNQTISGNKIFANDITVQGAVIVNQIIDITTTGSISGVTGEFKYIKTEGAMFSGGDVDFYADSYTFSGVDVNFYGNDYIFSGVNIYVANGTGFFTSKPLVNNIPVLLSGEATSNIEQFVKNDYGATLYKAQPVYVSGSNGNNILIHPASNSGEGTSSKTFGLLKQTLLNNEQGYVVTEGPLLNVDTSMATEGDPIWLGPTGNLIYGLANKPKAPQHLVSLGFVERAHQTQGKIFVKVQNGFEIEELHDVRIIDPKNNDIITYNSSSGLWLNSNISNQNIVFTTGNQIVSGVKTFADDLIARSGIEIYFSGDQRIGNVISGNWNNTGIAYTGIRYDISLGSGVLPSATNNLLDIFINNTGVLDINSKGQVFINQLGASVLENTLDVRRNNTSIALLRDDGAFGALGAVSAGTLAAPALTMQGTSIRVGANCSFAWTNANNNAYATTDVILNRDAANIMAQRNGLNPQQFRIYNLTGTNSGEFGLFGWLNNNLIIGAQQTQSGVLRNLTLTGQNINLSASGVIIPNPTIPANTGSLGVRGQISWDNDFIYVCVSGNSWKRAALTTW